MYTFLLCGYHFVITVFLIMGIFKLMSGNNTIRRHGIFLACYLAAVSVVFVYSLYVITGG